MDVVLLLCLHCLKIAAAAACSSHAQVACSGMLRTCIDTLGLVVFHSTRTLCETMRLLPVPHPRPISNSRDACVARRHGLLEAPAATTGAFPEEARTRQPRHRVRRASRRQGW